jgi:hypothetical protein
MSQTGQALVRPWTSAKAALNETYSVSVDLELGLV